MQKKMMLPIKTTIIKFNSDIDPDDLRGLIELSTTYQDIHLSRLDKYVKDVDEEYEEYEFLNDEADRIANIALIGEELAIIGLYKTIEVAIKKCAKLSELFTQTEISNMFKFNELKLNFLDKHIDIEKIEHFNSFDELRIINNCLKHSGKVNKELVKINADKWILNSDIKNPRECFNRLLNPSLKFLNLLGSEIILVMQDNLDR